jgi:prepilin-type N-terminal cleavage/methylation domain-containing protein
MGPIARGCPSARARMRAGAEGGFTIIELLIAMVILTIIMATLTSVLVSASHTEIDVNKRFQAQQNDRTGLDKVRREIHCGNAVTDTSGNSLTPGTAYNAITVTLPAQCPTASGGVTTYATWCTSPSTLNISDWALFRVTSTSLPAPTCASAGTVKWVDYLTTQTPFCLPDTTHSCGSPAVFKPTNSLPLLHVALPVNLNGPASTKESYNLVDDIALKNGARS